MPSRTFFNGELSSKGHFSGFICTIIGTVNWCLIIMLFTFFIVLFSFLNVLTAFLCHIVLAQCCQLWGKRSKLFFLPHMVPSKLGWIRLIAFTFSGLQHWSIGHYSSSLLRLFLSITVFTESFFKNSRFRCWGLQRRGWRHSSSMDAFYVFLAVFLCLKISVVLDLLANECCQQIQYNWNF